MLQGYSILAVVPARGGSKSIPRKNLAKIVGVSLVGHAANTIKKINWIDRAVISTDDHEIAAEGERHGLGVPFIRPPELSGDDASSVETWVHAWISSEKYYGCKFDISVLLEPTSPLRLPEDIERTVKVLVEEKFKAAATVSRTPAHYTPHKCLTIDDKGCIGFFLNEGVKYSIRQFIPEYYHRNGICYAATRETLVIHKKLLEDNCAAVLIERPVINIDEYIEMEIAEFLMLKRVN